jgi:alkyl sulfatase BDS1-like metallo-beta-lactamase superfamily hydrolase
MTLKYRFGDHRMVDLVRWDPDQSARRINDHILLSPGVSWSYVVTSDNGDVVVNTGMPIEGPRHRERFEQLLGRPLKVAKVVVTQSHPDHMGGWRAFADAQTEFIVQRDFAWLWQERVKLGPFFSSRLPRVLPSLTSPDSKKAWSKGAEEIPAPTLFASHHSFEAADRPFELFSTPSGETIDSCVVWLPIERTVFTGNLMGALQGSLPHFATLRGDRARSLVRFMQDMDLLIDLRPVMMVTGHGEPISGEGEIEQYLTRLRDAVRHIHDETMAGMIALKPLHQLMREIRLPDHLAHVPGRGRLGWYVRAMWEELTGWFRQESTTELYEVPQREIWSELVDLAGSDHLVARARAHLNQGRPVHALHFTDIVIAIDPAHEAARHAEIDALEQLIELGRGALADEQGWLETERARARTAIGLQ